MDMESSEEKENLKRTDLEMVFCLVQSIKHIDVLSGKTEALGLLTKKTLNRME